MIRLRSIRQSKCVGLGSLRCALYTRSMRAAESDPMNPQRLNILCVSQMPASPPRFGAQARMHGLMTQLARRHDLTAVMLVDEEFDIEECRRAMQVYCREVVLVPNSSGREGAAKRLLQLQSLVSRRSFDRMPGHGAGAAAGAWIGSCAPDASTSSTWNSLTLATASCARLRPARSSRLWSWTRTRSRTTWPGSSPSPAQTRAVASYASANWPQAQARGTRHLSREADGVYLCSAEDEQRLLDQIPEARTVVHS